MRCSRMGLEDVVDAVEHVESLLADGETGPVQDSLSWQQTDADVQLGKACAMLGTCRQLRGGTITTSVSSSCRSTRSNGRSSFTWWIRPRRNHLISESMSKYSRTSRVAGYSLIQVWLPELMRSDRSIVPGSITILIDPVETWQSGCTS